MQKYLLIATALLWSAVTVFAQGTVVGGPFIPGHAIIGGCPNSPVGQSTICVQDGGTSSSIIFGPGLNGAVCNDTTDDTAAFNALLAAVNTAGGGTIQISGTCLISGAVVFPNNGNSIPHQNPIRITGSERSANGANWGNPGASPSALDLQFNAPIAKLDTRGSGTLEIDHIALIDGGSDCATFIQTTNTTLYAHDILFRGTHAQAAACNTGIYLGGQTGTTGTIDGTSTGVFQGYGTVIFANYFDQIGVVVSFNTFANSVQMINNTVSLSSGGANAIVFQGSSGSNYLAGNLFEVTFYTNVYNISHSLGNVLIGNANWDGPGTGNTNLTGYSCGVNAGPQTIISAFENTNDATIWGNCVGIAGMTLLANSSSSGNFNIMRLTSLTLGNGGGIVGTGSALPVTGSAQYNWTPSADSSGDFRFFNAAKNVSMFFGKTGTGLINNVGYWSNLGINNGVTTSLSMSGVAPTIASGGCTSPSIPVNTGTVGFTVNVGTGCAGSQPIVLTLPAAINGWHCTARDVTTTSDPHQTGALSTTGATITNFALGGAVPVAWTANDIVEVGCMGY